MDAPGDDDAGAAAGAAVTFMTEAPLTLEAPVQATVGSSDESQATLLLKKRKDMRMLEDALETVKKEFASRMGQLAEAQARFEEKQRALQEMVSKFKPFVEENDAKRERALLKAKNEVGARERIESEIERLTGDLARQRGEKDAIANDIAALRKYAKYLEDVMSAAARGHGGVAESFESVQDVLARYGTLLNTNKDLHTQATRTTAELEALRTTVSTLQKRMRDTSLVAGSSTQEHVKRLELARATVSDLTAAREFAESDLRRTRAAAGQTDSSIRNLFARVIATAPPNSLPNLTLHNVAAALLSGSNGSTSGSGGNSASYAAAAYSTSTAPSTGAAAAAAAAASSSPIVLMHYLKQCLSVIGDRIADLGAIIDEYPAWKETTSREKEAAARSRSVTASQAPQPPPATGMLSSRAHARTAAPPPLSASTSSLHASHTALLTSVTSSASLGDSKSVAPMLSESSAGAAYGATPSALPGVFMVKFAVPGGVQAPPALIAAAKGGSNSKPGPGGGLDAGMSSTLSLSMSRSTAGLPPAGPGVRLAKSTSHGITASLAAMTGGASAAGLVGTK